MAQRLEDYAVVGAVFGIPASAALASLLLGVRPLPPEAAARIVAVRHEPVAQGAQAVELRLLQRLLSVPKAVAFRPLAAVPISRGQTLRTSVDWQNIGNITYAFDVLSLIGDWDPATGTFTWEYGWVALDVSVAAGAAVTTNLDGVIPDFAKGGLRDGLVAICDYDPATGEITKIYAAVVVEDAIEVTGVAAVISAVRYSVV